MKLILSVVALILGLAFLGYGVKFYISMSGLKKNAIKTTGKVIEVTTNKSKTGGLVYSPVILFTTQTGQEIKYAAQRYRNKKYNIGEAINILYNKENPNQVFFDTEMGVYGGVYFLLAAGLVCMLFAVYLFIKK